MTVPVPATPVGIAVRKLFSQLAARLGLRQTLSVYLAGGMVVYFYVGKRVSHDLDAEFGGRVLLPADLAVEIEGEEPVYFDTNFNPMFALVHENYQREAVTACIGDPADIRHKITLAEALAQRAGQDP
jgi:hypothetical protein